MSITVYSSEKISVKPKIRTKVDSMSEQIKRLTTENEALKTEIRCLKEEKEEDRRRILLLENQIN